MRICRCVEYCISCPQGQQKTGSPWPTILKSGLPVKLQEMSRQFVRGLPDGQKRLNRGSQPKSPTPCRTLLSIHDPAACMYICFIHSQTVSNVKSTSTQRTWPCQSPVQLATGTQHAGCPGACSRRFASARNLPGKGASRCHFQACCADRGCCCGPVSTHVGSAKLLMNSCKYAMSKLRRDEADGPTG